MNKRKAYILLVLSLLLLFGIGSAIEVQKNKEFVAKLATQQKIFTAGDTVRLRFEQGIVETTDLFISSSYGQTLLSSATGDFVVPSFITSKKGNITYTLIANNKVLYKGNFEIKAKVSNAPSLESYVGPPSMIAGGKDHTMQVVIPTDMYDNPLPDSTIISLRHQFLDVEKEKSVITEDMIGWSTIYSYEQSGRLFISSVVGETSSKEFSIDVFSSLPQDFEITTHRKHTYADGNQITEFRTSVLKDAYNNTISDGTIVQFMITNNEGNLLHTMGSTINGQAIGKILHPDRADSWKIQAIIPGIAQSNTIQIDYKPVLESFVVQLSDNNRKITVGPLLSFMDQLIPDGALVKVTIYQKGKLLETKVGYATEGKARFQLKKEFYGSGKYDVDIEAFGIRKRMKQLHLR